jgi:hydrogenase-4 component B
VTALLVLLGVAAVGGGGALALGRRTLVAGLGVQAGGCAVLATGGLWALVARESFGSRFTSAFDPRVGVDPLSGLFLAILGAVGAAALVFAARYLEPSGRGRVVASLTALFVLVQALVLVARDPLTFLVAWEAMTLVPAAVILVGRADELARRTVFFYVALTHLAGAGTWTAILLLAREGAIGDPTALTSGSGIQIAIALTALVGMGAKAGVMPLHVWLPLAHPIAPAPVSALMSGVMIKIAIYGLVRVLVEWVGVLPEWLGVLVLALGALSAVGGVVYALFQHELKRLLAFHSIENIGIIVLGLGACVLLRARGADEWAAIALAASLLHTVNHALFKSLLFLGAGSFGRAVGALGLVRL